MDATSTSAVRAAVSCVEAIRLNLARSVNTQTYGRTAWTGRFRPYIEAFDRYDDFRTFYAVSGRTRRPDGRGTSRAHATLRVAYSAISAIGGRSSVSTE
ncbi:hypothetical protein Saso_34320 [Streptomyces asoensis]|uniref:Uncharacterized protein n=1 Tax=Streptomyces asoensis TaxID=249586 RepID=A0ABQ3S0Y4_9ACTN|nr:hypothetical protein GCM10010496_27670 [Streptomyces asoensis]GHI61782.1 hypothetical protein Saso_34320 [Streptomyces asoensis]